MQVPRSALEWSAHATHDFLGGPGRWVVALPTDRVAGFQVLNRARLAAAVGINDSLVVCGPMPNGTEVHFSVSELIDALAAAFRLSPAPVYLSLVPTELFALFNAPITQRELALSLLARCQAILVGGAALDPALRDDAIRHGLNLVATYGMTETSGGCVYDGIPLPGVSVRLAELDADGIGVIEISGPMLADGYLEVAAQPPYYYTANDGTRWFRTTDLGRWSPDGKLEVIGRLDDVINTGGVKVHPHLVEEAVETAWFQVLDQEVQVAVIGLPNSKWGQEVTAVIQPAASVQITDSQLRQIQALIKQQLGPIATPKTIRLISQLPMLASGKIDRKALITNSPPPLSSDAFRAEATEYPASAE